ncbi:putative C6 transcription factor [Aspergillus alliaceus]|uniref:putative C6 transcription factor n=1 Tax=Petromyces alliaceus TaxID=209559 RepID=UPI0012A538C9|nr:uncharacterized protein BDW43DRAFT_322158 [Aspergillus alliaceus]KAB8229524.1 hypothetical protein BDW43DRAFT_322158 [Aspergillus alliaceus]
MVYCGPSCACETCKLRKKKCDETRPSCIRCLKSNRTCKGYEVKDSLGLPLQPPLGSLARKCSLPARDPAPGTDALPDDAHPKEVTGEVVEESGLRAFFYDYCVVSTHRSLSRGFFHKLGGMVRFTGFRSDLAKACKVVEFGGHEMLYQELLNSFAQTIGERSVESAGFLTTVKIVLVGEIHLGYHNNSPLSLLGAVQSDHPLLCSGMPKVKILSPADFEPTTVGQIVPEANAAIPGVGYWPGRVGMYFDFYVAVVWNTSRVARCLLLDLILNVASILNYGNRDHTRKQRDALCLLEQIVCSMPYHLAEDLPDLLRNHGNSTKITTPARAAGGLLMHPIYTTSQLSIIGTHMGIGQALIFAKAAEVHPQDLAGG